MKNQGQAGTLQRKHILRLIGFICLICWTGVQAQHASHSLSLDGRWEIVFDPSNVGVSQGWFLDDVFDIQEKRSIEVPSCWEEYNKNYEGVAFYRKKFILPEDWQDKIMHLEFEASNYKTEVWVNGVGVGYHEGGYTPFRFRIDEMIKAGQENTVTVRVLSPIIYSDQRIDGIGRQEVPMWRGGLAGGIWQSVHLYATDVLGISDVFIQTDIHDSSATFSIELNNYTMSPTAGTITLDILTPEGNSVFEQVKTKQFVPGKNKLQWKAKICDVTYWSPDQPYLYQSRIRIKYEDQVSDTWSAKFGIRAFTLKDKMHFLNGKPIYLKAIFFEGVYPVKVANMDSRAMAIKEITLAKEAGFNMIRPWRKPPPEEWLDLCDSIGMLTVGSLVTECMGRPVPTPQLGMRVENELTQSVLRDRNRTCVVLWELFNEIHKGGVMNQMRNSMSLLARELDPTRLILDESGGWDAANLYLPYEKSPIQINDIHHYPGNVMNQTKFNRILMIGKTAAQRQALGFADIQVPGRHHKGGLPSFISELGYASWPNFIQNNKEFNEKGNPLLAPAIEHKRLAYELQQAFVKTGFDAVFPDFEAYCLEEQRLHGISNKRMMEAARVNPDVNGYCIHALTAGDWILGAGILDLWRNPKTLAYEKTKEANQSRLISIRILSRNIYAGKDARLTIDGVNELASTSGVLSVRIASELGVAYEKQVKVNFDYGVAQLLSDDIRTNEMQGSYTVSAVLRDDKGHLLASNEAEFDVFTKQELKLQLPAVAVVESGHKITSFLEENAVSVVDFRASNRVTIPVLVHVPVQPEPAFIHTVAEVKDFANRGGKVIFLNVHGTDITWHDGTGAARKMADFDISELPLSGKLVHTDGNYISRTHIVTNHPVFEGLPVNTIMYGPYENILNRTRSICRPSEGKILSGVISYDQNKNMDIWTRHFKGVGDVWWGADILEVDKGKGTLLFSNYDLVNNLGTDPVADKLVINMLHYMRAK